MPASQPIAPTPTPLPVILVGRDRSRMAFRQRAIEGAGIPARSCSPEQVEGMAHDARARVWVFCGSVEVATLVYLAGSLRRYSPESRLLLLEWNVPTGVEGSLFHRILDGTANGEMLAKTVQEAAGCTEFQAQRGSRTSWQP